MEIHQTTSRQIRGLLNEDQQKKYDAMEKERQQEMQHNGRGGMGGDHWTYRTLAEIASENEIPDNDLRWSTTPNRFRWGVVAGGFRSATQRRTLSEPPATDPSAIQVN